MSLNRRTFIVAGGSALVAQTPPLSQITLGVVGVGGRGTFVMTVFQKNGAARVGAICDVYEPNLENGLSVAAKTAGTHPKAYRNYKELLNDKELRVRAIMTLGEIGPPAEKIAPELKKLLQGKDGDTQLASAFALWQITGDAKESMKVLNGLLATEKHYTPTIQVLGQMGPAAESLLPTLVALWREEDVRADRLALANAIKQIDPKAALRLGIK